ncbi:hypothetical protein FOMPIDRAFT_48720 [Fomitopsis schrenkii]|uniref:DUF6589 domain-containing protein n=1 Tax=Fomitopsis schrenkii TaxID=2126942 RepID=S8FXA5_FOMSC|nr:hypothetical protein FOMPIDRAFT_48720 [Fomitopsis schrenkii]
MTLLTAPNDYERKHGKEKKGKDTRFPPVIVVIISMLLFARNRATNVFQVVIGIFLSGTGASRRVMNTFNHMGLCSISTVQRCLVSLSQNAEERANVFIRTAGRLWGLVYDNINFTLRKASQRLDSTTEQLNATTSAALRHQVRMILLTYAPGLQKKNKRNRRVRRSVTTMKPQIRVLSHEKTEFYPLRALAQEEASVAGTIKVVVKLFTQVLRLAEEVVASQLRLLVGDWLTIRNLRLVKDEVAEEFTSFTRMDWIHEASMPFHFQLNAMHMLFRTHLGHPSDNNPSSLEHHRVLLKRSKLDPTKPEYNKAKELLYHSLIARIVADFASTSAAKIALTTGDEVLAHAILFMRDALIFREFAEAIRDADFIHVLPALLQDIVENTWLVNRWGKQGCSIPTDLYLEHNNGFLKVFFL